MWALKHLANDWLAGTWFLFWANACFTFGAFVLLLGSFALGSNPEQIFLWLSSFASSGLFLIGSAYFVAGSYPHAQQFYYASGRGQIEIDKQYASVPSSPDLEATEKAATTAEALGLPAGKKLPTFDDAFNPLHTPIVHKDSPTPPSSSSAFRLAPKPLSSSSVFVKSNSGTNLNTIHSVEVNNPSVPSSQSLLEAEDENRDDDEDDVEAGDVNNPLLTISPLHTHTHASPPSSSVSGTALLHTHSGPQKSLVGGLDDDD
jgi:hypothetical protein